MNRTITVKGIGNVSARPDYAVISMEIESKAKEYAKAVELAAENIDQLTNTLMGAGFEKEALKTTNFNVRTELINILAGQRAIGCCHCLDGISFSECSELNSLYQLGNIFHQKINSEIRLI